MAFSGGIEAASWKGGPEAAQPANSKPRNAGTTNLKRLNMRENPMVILQILSE
jgi:hypothetical protein